MITQRELDGGGWARLDVSDLLSGEDESNDSDNQTAVQGSCDWCVQERAPGEYLVVADNRHFNVCPTCWGRSAGYVELRQAGLPHEAALSHIGGAPLPQ
jgi:hypothetical protein